MAVSIDIPILGRRPAADVRVCRGCGCDDNHACLTEDGPCAWFLCDVGLPTGICTVCAVEMDFDPEILAGAMCGAVAELLVRRGYLDEERLGEALGAAAAEHDLRRFGP